MVRTFRLCSRRSSSLSDSSAPRETAPGGINPLGAFFFVRHESVAEPRVTRIKRIQFTAGAQMRRARRQNQQNETKCIETRSAPASLGATHRSFYVDHSHGPVLAPAT